MFEQLHRDILGEIFAYMSQPELFNMLLLNMRLLRMISDYPVFVIDSKEDLKTACRQNCIISIKRYVKKSKKKDRIALLNRIFKYACRYGHQNMIDYIMLSGKYDVNTGLIGAARGGRIELVERMIELGATALGCALYESCKDSEDGNIAYFICNRISFRKKKIEKRHSDLNLGLRGACKGGNKTMIAFMTRYGADDYKGGFVEACKAGHLDIAKGMTAYNQSRNEILDYALSGIYPAISNCHLNIVKWLLSIISPNFLIRRKVLYEACKTNNDEMIDYIVSKGFDDFNHTIQWAIFQENDEDTFDIIINIIERKNISKDQYILDYCLADACQQKSRYLIGRLIDLGANRCWFCRGTVDDHLRVANNKYIANKKQKAA